MDQTSRANGGQPSLYSKERSLLCFLGPYTLVLFMGAPQSRDSDFPIMMAMWCSVSLTGGQTAHSDAKFLRTELLLCRLQLPFV